MSPAEVAALLTLVARLSLECNIKDARIQSLNAKIKELSPEEVKDGEAEPPEQPAP